MTEQKQDALVQHRPQGTMARWRMAPSSLGEAMEMAQLIAGSELCPKAYRGRPQDCIVCYEYGSALGLSWMQSLRSVSVINGQGALWGDAIPALIYGSGECQRFHEFYEGEKGTDTYTAVCIMHRRGMPDEVKRTFSVADAKKAGLWTKQNTPWQTYPDRMLQMRARGFAARDTFADKLSGLILAEEAMDYPTIEGTVVASEVVEPPKSQTVFEGLPEPVRDTIEKAFATLNFSSAQRLTKLNEYLGGAGIDPDAQANALLDWCRDEFAKRKTGQPRKKSTGNGKETSSPPATAGQTTPQAAGSDGAHAGSDVRVAGPEGPSGTSGPVASQSQTPAAAVTPAVEDTALF